MADSKIEWTNKVWNPVTGCDKVSAGCKNCYAGRLAETRLKHKYYYKDGFYGNITLHYNRLRDPMSWRKPAMIFVNSMSDLFHPDVPFSFIDDVFITMHNCPQHIFQILTKRPERLLEYYKHNREQYYKIYDKSEGDYVFTLDNVWLGVSIEDQKTADLRIPILQQVPVAVRWLSAEPLLDDISLWKHLIKEKIHWIVAGGESGPKARQMSPNWAWHIRNECLNFGVPFFFKQGSQNNWPNYKNFDLFPSGLQVREFPLITTQATVSKSRGSFKERSPVG